MQSCKKASILLCATTRLGRETSVEEHIERVSDRKLPLLAIPLCCSGVLPVCWISCSTRSMVSE